MKNRTSFPWFARLSELMGLPFNYISGRGCISVIILVGVDVMGVVLSHRLYWLWQPPGRVDRLVTER